MKSRCFCIAFFLTILFSSLTGKGQTLPFRQRLLLGATGGVNLSNVIFTPNVQQTFKVGYDGGLVFRYDVGHVYDLPSVTAGVWIEVDYSRRGWREQPDELPEAFEGKTFYYERKLSFISIPMMTHLMFGNKRLKFTVDAGPQFGYLIGESSDGTFPEGGIAGVVTRQQSMPVENKFAWGLGGGIGVEYHLNKMIFGVRGAYVYGLGEIYGNTRGDYFGKSSEQVFSLKTYVLFDLMN